MTAILFQFQSTPPARGATLPARFGLLPYLHFNPRPPRGGRPGAVLRILQIQQISIHAPREGGDSDQSYTRFPYSRISIHAPREGGDKIQYDLFRGVYNFNPRPPRGGRRSKRFLYTFLSKFQSTPPARGATERFYAKRVMAQISIHAPREGGDTACIHKFLR